MLLVYWRSLRYLANEFSLTLSLLACSALVGLLALVEPLIIGKAIDALRKNQDIMQLMLLWSGLGALSIFLACVTAVNADQLAHRLRLRALIEGFSKAANQPATYLQSKGHTWAIDVVTDGSDRLFNLWLTVIRDHFPAGVAVVVLFSVAVALNRTLGAALVLLFAFHFAVSIIVTGRTRHRQICVDNLRRNIISRAGDALTNITLLQSFLRVKEELRSLEELCQNLLKQQYPVLRWWGVVTVLNRSASTISLITIVWLGTNAIRSDNATVGELVTFLGFATILTGTLDRLTDFTLNLSLNRPTLATYFELIDKESAFSERPDAKVLPVPVKGCVVFDDVSFSFPHGKGSVHNLTFRVQQGQTVALVGPTGAGKTATLSLLQGFSVPKLGHIYIDGADIQTVSLTSLRQSIATVFQESMLLNRTIAENLRIGRPTASGEEIDEAARIAEALHFIEEKPSKYQYIVGENGAFLSGGERQRLTIARALLKNAPILILDEATSALDSETERRIQRALNALRAGKTTFIIAHRLSTVTNADLVLVFQDGRIVEQGSFQALMARENGVFSRIVTDGKFLGADGRP